MEVNKTDDSDRGRIGDFIEFKNLVQVLENISNAGSNDRKKEVLKKYVNFLRKNFESHYRTLDSEKAEGDSLYCVIRVLLPHADRGRKAYGFKSVSLGRMFADILALDKASRDRKRLIGFKDPHQARASAGDIASVIYNVWKERFSEDPENRLKLSEVHKILDKIARGADSDVNQEYQKKILQGLVRKLSALEVKWLIRILLKDMHLGFSSTKNAVYELLHPQAKLLSESIGDLEVLCQKLNDPNVEVQNIDVLLFSHFRPMLATRMDAIESTYDTGGSLSSSVNHETSKTKAGNPKADVVSLPPPPFYVETKWDGERFQIHYDGQEFKYFSRRAFDFSGKFNHTLTPKLKERVNPGVKSFIVDGEMMAFNMKYKIFTQKGYNIDVKTMNKDNPNHCPVFVAFDLVYYNGEVLTKRPLKERLEKLTRVFAVKEDTVRLSEVKIMNSKEDVIECLNRAIDDGEEGLIAKNMNSSYEPGKRPVTWLKIKPEYLADSSVDDMDFVILGGYYTESTRRGGEINHFLIGLKDSSKGKAEYYPVAKVGSGRLRSLEVKEMVEELKQQFTKTPSENVHYQARKKPDFMINPAKSIVVQVKASEIIPSDVYALNYTLRFPRITKIRKDKRPDEIMTAQEFHRIREAGGGKLVKRTDRLQTRHTFAKKRHHSDYEDSDDDDGPSRTKKTTISQDEDDVPLLTSSTRLLSIISNNKTKPILSAKTSISPLKAGSSSLTVPAIKSSTATLNVTINVFKGKVFCVYGSTSWKAEMEAKIRRNGGNISQSPDVKDLFAIIAERRSSVLVRKAVDSQKYNVLQPTWLLKCIEAGDEVPTVPLDYWGMTSDTRDQFAEEYDEYGDSYTKENTIAENKELVMRIMEDEDEEERRSRSSATPSPQKVPIHQPPVPDSPETDDGNGTEGDSSTDFSESESVDIPLNQAKVRECIEPTPKLSSGCKSNFMDDVHIFFRGCIDPVLNEQFKFYGGKVAESEENEPGVTHVVCMQGTLSKEDHPRAFVVTQKWLEDCLEKKEVLEEMLYLARR